MNMKVEHKIKSSPIKSQGIKSSTIKSKKKRIRNLCTTSERNDDLYFSNFLPSSNKQGLKAAFVTNIQKVMQCTEITELEMLPFYDDSLNTCKPLRHNQNDISRVESILSLYVTDYQLKSETGEDRFFVTSPKFDISLFEEDKKTPLRYIVRKNIDENVWEVIIIDVNHLITTEKYKHKYQQNNMKSFNKCLSSISPSI